VLDGSEPLTDDDRAMLGATVRRVRVVAASKSDLPAAWSPDDLDAGVIPLSAKTGEGLDALRRALVIAAGGEPTRDVPAITNIRHADLLERARAALTRAAAAADSRTPEEFVVADLTDVRRLLEEVTGARTADDVLHAIFDRFCIGK
jgi:tRNA modification GTPase